MLNEALCNLKPVWRFTLSLSLSLSIHRIVSQTVDVIIHVGCRYNSGVEGPEILVVTLIYFSDSHLRRNVRNRENSAGNRRRRVRLVWSQSEKTNNSRCSSRYVGSHCVVELLKEDFNVICIDNFVNCQRGKVFLICRIFIERRWCFRPWISRVHISSTRSDWKTSDVLRSWHHQQGFTETG